MIQSPPGVNVVGFFRAEFGQGEIARRLAAALSHGGIPYRTVPYDRIPYHRQEHAFEHVAGSDFPVNVLCLNAEHLLEFAGSGGGELLVDHYSIGVWFWETSRFPDSLRPALKFVDELWVASEFVAEALADAAVPVRIFPLPVVVEPVHASRSDLGLPDDRFVFSFVFDFLSTVERKNPLGLVETYKRAFEPDDGAFLVVKSINGHLRASELQALRAAALDRPDISIVDGFVAADHIRAYTALADSTVSLHRSEGFGLTLAESMAHGKATVATGYSGNRQFMDDENSYLVPYDLVEVEHSVGPYPAGSVWADPDPEAGARLMRHVFEQRGEAAARAERGRQTIEANHSIAAAADFLTTRLRDLEDLRVSRTVKGPTRNATDYLARGPELSWEARGRTGRVGVWLRKLLRRGLRPYTERHREFEHAVVDALRELEQRVDELERQRRGT
jgi:glycosyltransferase involved in cell wall biosynthesis